MFVVLAYLLITFWDCFGTHTVREIILRHMILHQNTAQQRVGSAHRLAQKASTYG